MNIDVKDIEKLPARYQKQINEQLNRGKKKSKYNNTKIKYGEIEIDSEKEYNRLLYLKNLLNKGEISDLKLQHHFHLQEAYVDADGKKVKKIEYIADFTYTNKDGEFVVEDVKSEHTRKLANYSLKKRLMANKGYHITEVIY